MNAHRLLRRATAPMAAVAVLFASACQDEQLADPMGAPANAGSLTLQVSSGSARAGDLVGVSLFVDGGEFAADPLVGLQGRIRFNVNQLEYVGQEMGQSFAIANEATADRGAVTFANLDPKGLSGRTATFAFRVRSEGYLAGLRFELDEAATRSLKGARIRRIETVVVSDLDAPASATSISLADWRVRFGVEGGVQLTPGDYRDDLKYGDADLNGSISIAGDAFYVASVSVGNQALIANSDQAGAFGSLGKDGVIAGNVFPFNLAPSTLPPGWTSATNAGDLSIFDASAIANEAVGNLQPVVGDIIPGRAAAARGRVVVSANITSNTTWTANNVYELAGVIRVNSGAVLTIEPGTQIEGQRSTTTALFIEREGMIMANGTAAQPIIFTCTGDPATKFKGCWSGLWIAGWAPINEGNSALGTAPAFGTRNPTGGQIQNQGEGNGPLYGGGNAADNSGVLRYAVVEYGGFILSTANELNNLTLGGVGNGTTIEYVETRNGLDDGFEMFGGTVNMRYLMSIGNSDDSFDGAQGWNGSAQFVIIQHDPADSDKGLEFDNANSSSLNNALPRTTPAMYNFTIVGEPAPADPATGDNNDSEDALHIRKGSRPDIKNFLVSSFGRVFRLDNAETCDIDGTGELKIQNSIFDGYLFLSNSNAFPTGTTSPTKCAATNADEGALLNAEPGNRFSAAIPAALAPMIDPLDAVTPDFRLLNGSANAAATGGAPAPAGNTFIQSVTYVGAVNPLAGNAVPWFAGWSRGYARTQYYKTN
ncbi:MAG: hypothetical protein SFV24_24255 [Gemmatimonadales bacterium]|nr:hypothetical protein [Gemmatimonadales bacterium]